MEDNSLSPAVDEQTLEHLRHVSTSTLATQLYRRGIRQPFLVGLTPLNSATASFVGLAYTMRFIPSREDIDPLDDPYRTGNTLQWQAIEEVGPGQVVVVDSRGDTSAASAGDMLLTRAMKRGAVGFITDGALRDGHAIAELDIAAFSKGVTATTRPASFHVADLQVPIGCAGVAVYPGDVLVGDADGVIVVPRALAREIAEPAREQEQLEAWLLKQVQHGQELWGTYPPSDETLDRYSQEMTLQNGEADA